MAMISARASSTTLRVLENGALKTTVPACAAASRSIWLVPMQKAPMTLSSGRASSTARVTCVLERMPTMSTPSRAAISSASSRAPERVSTSKPASVRATRAASWMFSSSRTFTFSRVCLCSGAPHTSPPCGTVRPTAIGPLA